MSDNRTVQTRDKSEDEKQAEETGDAHRERCSQSVENELMAGKMCEEKAPRKKSPKRKKQY